MPKQTDTPYKSGPLTKGSPGDDTIRENVPREDAKKTRGLSKDAGRSPNEAGTDQRVEDAKKARQ